MGATRVSSTLTFGTTFSGTKKPPSLCWGLLAGFMRDELGDYDLAFLVLAGLNMIGAVLFLVARKPKLPGVVQTNLAT
jgi:hypothetical protein